MSDWQAAQTSAASVRLAAIKHTGTPIFESHSYISQQLICISCDFINMFLR